MKRQRIAIMLLIILTMLTSALPFSYAQDGNFADLSKFEGKKIGIQTGATHINSVKKYIKNPDVKFFDATADMLVALKSGKVDAIVSDECQLQYAISTTDGIICERLKSYPDYISPVTAKTPRGEMLLKELNKYISKIKSDGELDELTNKWIDGSEEGRTMEDYTTLPNKRGIIKIATDPAYPPFEYSKNNQLVGFDIEFMGMFCKEFGYKPVYNTLDFSGIIPGIVSGKYDVGASCFSISEERAKIVNFTDTIYTNYAGIASLNASDQDFFGNIKNGFTNTFITEARWKSFLSGIYVTLLITIISVIAGTLLGFLAHILYRGKSKFIKKALDIISRIIKGMPEVVFLMILFYIVFRNSQLSGTIISIIAFTLTFACSTRNILKTGENSIDIGQFQAATALGYRENAIFLKIIFPQVVKNSLSNYIESISSHIKGTAVVGYIAVVDVTKVGDIIRGRTYDAFFPLIAVAILYFIMAWILKCIVKFISKRAEERERKKNLIEVEI